MKIRSVFLICLVFFVILFLGLTAFPLHTNVDTIKLQNPNEIYNLYGEKLYWYFQPVDELDFKNSEIRGDSWSRIHINDDWKKFDKFKNYRGLGWYRLNVIVYDEVSKSLFIPKSFRGIQVYINGYFVGETKPFTADGNTPSAIAKPQVLNISNTYLKKGKNVIAIRAGELDGFSAIAPGLAIGPSEKIHLHLVKYILWYGSIASFFIFLSIFFTGFYITRRINKYYLYYAGFSFSLGVWILGHKAIILYFFDYQLIYNVFTYCGGILSAPLLISFIHSFLGIRKTWITRLLEILYLMFFITFLLDLLIIHNVRFFNDNLFNLFSEFNIIIVFYSIVISIYGVLHKIPYSPRILFGTCIFTFLIILSTFHMMGFTHSRDYVIESYLFLTLIFASILASRYAQIYTDLEHTHGKLLVLDKMKDEFMATTSHELRTPLHGIMGLAETLLINSKEPLTPRQGETVGIIHKSAERLSRLVNDILDFSRLNAKKSDLMTSKVMLGEMLRGLVSLARGMAQDKPVGLGCTISEDLPDIVADKHRLEQIIINLLGNAVKFTENGSVELTACADVGGVRIEVRDTGCGIPAGMIDRIWNPYEQLEEADTRRHGGSGLGLAITRNLVDLHGGNISVESEHGKGSLFTVWLPMVPPGHDEEKMKSMRAMEGIVAEPVIGDPEPEAEQNEEPGEPSPRTLRKEEIRILAVDDDPVNLRVAIDALSMEGYRVITAATGPEALASVGENAPHCVLLDIMLPGMSGYEVASTIRKNQGQGYLPIIMVTARSQTEDLMKGFLYGANDYITKPFNIRELLLRVENQLVIRNLIEMEKKVGSHLLVERNRVQTGMLERSVQLNEVVHKLSDWERIISEDLDIARRFLGKLMTMKVTAAEVDYALHFDPLHTIGGDVYDINEYTPGKIRVFIADATGHGINASLNTITIMTEYDLIRSELISPPEILAAINDRFCRKLAQYRILFTCCVAEIDLFAGTLRFSSAGHPEQYLLKAGGEVVPLKPRGPIIGFRKNTEFEEQTFAFAPGSLLFCYTDGLLDDDPPPVFPKRKNHRAMRNEQFLQGVLSENHGEMSAEELCYKVKSVMKGSMYKKERHSDDDITMIALKRR